MKNLSFSILVASLTFIFVVGSHALDAQNSGRKMVLIDVGHGEKFWHDPAAMQGMDAEFIERVKYMTGEIKKSAASNNAEIGYIRGTIKSDDIKNASMIFMHIPSTSYDQNEVETIKQFIQNGGALFIVMDEDYWSTLGQANVNDIVNPFGIQFEGKIPDSLSGGYTKAGVITPKPRKVTYHGARIVKGGTPFCFSSQSNTAFGTFAAIPGGGKVIAMGDGMVSLYMTSWNGVENYQCQEFMTDAFAWLLK